MYSKSSFARAFHVVGRALGLTTACVLICGGLFSADAQNTIYTVAGGGSVAGPAMGANADLAAPSAVAKDANGNLYIADASAHYVYKVDASGNLTVFAGIGHPREHPINDAGLQATAAGLNVPSGVAVDPNGIVYIADTVNYMIRRVDLTGAITSIAGNSKLCQTTTAPCGDGGVGRGAQLNYPIGVTTDAAGNVYIADTGDNRIRVVNVQKVTITIAGVSIAAGTIQTVAGTGAKCTTPASSCGDGGAPLSAQLNNPQGVAVDAAGNIYIADSGDHRIRIVNASTAIISDYAGSGTQCNLNKGCGDGGSALIANLSNPFQIALDAAGNLFITDPPTSSIRKVDAQTGNISTVAGNGHPGYSGDGGPAISAQINGSRGVAVDASGNVFLADTGNEVIRQFVAGGNIGTFAGGGSGNDGSLATSAILGAGRGVALDSFGNLYIADTYNNRIRIVKASDQTISTVAGTGIAGFSATQFNFPSSVAVDSANNLYVADTGNFAIRKVDPTSQIISTVAGVPQQSCKSGTTCGDGGLATSATFGKPTSVAVDSAGNIYIADAAEDVIRVVNMGSTTLTIGTVNIPPGFINTVAGQIGQVCKTHSKGSCGDNGPANVATLNDPFGVAVDGSGNIYIADTGDNRIREVVATGNNAGNIVPFAFSGGTFFGPTNVPALNSQYFTPHYVTVDPRGNVYVASSDIYYVPERIDAVSGYVVPIAGVPSDPKFYGLDGDGGLALGSHVNPAGMAIDGAGHLFMADNGNNRVREILLTPAATLSVATLNFGATTVGTTSAPLNFTLTNGGSDDLYISNIAVSGPFALQTSTCSNNIVPPRAACTFSMTFTPVTTGPASGSITISDNALGSPSQSVTLNGSGQ